MRQPDMLAKAAVTCAMEGSIAAPLRPPAEKSSMLRLQRPYRPPPPPPLLSGGGRQDAVDG